LIFTADCYSFCVTVTQGNVKMAAGAHRKTGTPNPMTAAGKVEHALVAQTIEEIMAPRLTGEVIL
jgi:hypothetical protein